MEHELKLWAARLDEIQSGAKKAELRKNDRNYQIGDTLKLREYVFQHNTYTGRAIRVKVTHIIYGGKFGLEHGYCVLSIEPISGIFNE